MKRLWLTLAVLVLPMAGCPWDVEKVMMRLQSASEQYHVPDPEWTHFVPPPESAPLP